MYYLRVKTKDGDFFEAKVTSDGLNAFRYEIEKKDKEQFASIYCRASEVTTAFRIDNISFFSAASIKEDWQ